MKKDAFIEIHSMGLDCVQLIDNANNKNSIIIKFLHNDNDESKAIKINVAEEQLIAERIKANLKNGIKK